MAATPPTPYRFSPEEMRVLQECNKESFYQRCLPFSTFFGVGTYMAVKSGFLQSSVKYGSAPKVIGAVLVGYFLGKLSYQPKCAEKMMSIPDSKIGAILRARKYGTDVLTMDDQDLERTVSSLPETDKFSDISSQKNQLDMDLERPLISGLEDYRPNTMDDVRLIYDDPLFPSTSSRTTTYEDLRRKNREEYEQRRTKAYRGVVTPEDVPSGLRVDDRSPLDTQPTRPTNIYGDLFEK